MKNITLETDAFRLRGQGLNLHNNRVTLRYNEENFLTIDFFIDTNFKVNVKKATLVIYVQKWNERKREKVMRWINETIEKVEKATPEGDVGQIIYDVVSQRDSMEVMEYSDEVPQLDLMFDNSQTFIVDPDRMGLLNSTQVTFFSREKVEDSVEGWVMVTLADQMLVYLEYIARRNHGNIVESESRRILVNESLRDQLEVIDNYYIVKEGHLSDVLNDALPDDFFLDYKVTRLLADGEYERKVTTFSTISVDHRPFTRVYC